MQIAPCVSRLGSFKTWEEVQAFRVDRLMSEWLQQLQPQPTHIVIDDGPQVQSHSDIIQETPVHLWLGLRTLLQCLEVGHQKQTSWQGAVCRFVCHGSELCLWGAGCSVRSSVLHRQEGCIFHAECWMTLRYSIARFYGHLSHGSLSTCSDFDRYVDLSISQRTFCRQVNCTAHVLVHAHLSLWR